MKTMLTEEQIYEIQQLATLPRYTKKQVCEILGLEYVDMLDDKEFNRAFKSGKLLAAGQFDKKVQALSNQGSGPAQSLLHKMMKERETDEMREYYG